ncbi:hypothetical protein MOV73_003780 [Raoultella ornithinolytica]|nr:hypothetical protein [Raoultella ornithinolytica]EKW7116234.1 hypothetical protein [Raoultella ornithinolytica]ELS0866515.1 hypothetical protein [Raoultella ornithinolytica]
MFGWKCVHDNVVSLFLTCLRGVKVLYTVTFNETGRKEDFELGDDVRPEDLLSLTLDGVKEDFTVMTFGGPIIDNTCVPSIIRVKKAQK